MTEEELECEKYLHSVRDRELAEIATNINKALVTRQFQELEEWRWVYEELQLMYSITIETFRTNPVFRARMVVSHNLNKALLEYYDDLGARLASS